ncbi:MAG TPA: hypothetical protein VIJ38_14055 [Acidobacteriaceae bacterium]
MDACLFRSGFRGGPREVAAFLGDVGNVPLAKGGVQCGATTSKPRCVIHDPRIGVRLGARVRFAARVVGIHHVCFSLNIYKQSKKEKFVQQRYNRIVLNCPTLCGEEWKSSDVVWLGLRLNDQFDTGAGLEWLGEVALLAEGNDVVVKGRSVAVGDDGDSEGGVLAAVLGDAAGG